MEKLKDVQVLSEMFSSNGFATKTVGIAIDSVTDEETVCKMMITPAHLNTANIVQGGAIFTLADFCFAVAARADGYMAATLDCTITYITKAVGTYLKATAKLVAMKRTVCMYDVTVTDDQGRKVAVAQVTGFIVGERK